MPATEMVLGNSPSRNRIDLRSDTVTVPTPAMREAMFAAAVGDDVFGEDPTVNALEAEAAKLLGHEAALFVPSGTMANQIAIKLHTQPGDEVFCEAQSHIYLWEAGGPALLSGVSLNLLAGDRGMISLSRLCAAVRPENVHHPRPRLVCLENTHNRANGAPLPFEEAAAVSNWCRVQGLRRHLDGARLMNAVVATGIPAHRWGSLFDTVSLCFSKGLGAPVGSVLAGTREQIHDARRYRKIFGGGMRQVGFLAAACRHALQHHIDRLADDHQHAQRLAQALAEHPGFHIDPATVGTNILWVPLRPGFATAAAVTAYFADHGVDLLSVAEGEVRMVTHLNVSSEQIDRVCALIRAMPDRLPS